MFQFLKKRLYFAVAHYFRFWATVKLDRWSPTVIVVTGSAGKTTMLHFLEAQLGPSAHYSHHANSAFGIPFDILGLTGIKRSRIEWFWLVLRAPFTSLGKVPSEQTYIAEVDAERPGEAPFLARLLKPNITLWISLHHTHSSQFDYLVKRGQFTSAEAAVADEYGTLLEATKELVIVNADEPLMLEQTRAIAAAVERIGESLLKAYRPGLRQTTYELRDKTYTLSALLPRATFYQVAMVDRLLQQLGKEPDFSYRRFVMPPGRSNVLSGVKKTTLIDSTYNNSNRDSLREVLELFAELPVKHKWAVVGDMLEQGEAEASEHAKLATTINKLKVDRLILVGPRVKAHTYPKLSAALRKQTEVFEEPRPVLEYLQQHLEGGETVLFKGVRYLEGVVEQLLANPEDAAKLPRREPMYIKRRAEWGL